jgi:hypothetical protein
VKIGIDIGGVISKYPNQFRYLIDTLRRGKLEVYAITDMSYSKAEKLLEENSIFVDGILACSYELYGENCKTEMIKSTGLDLIIDDHMGYLMGGNHIRLLMMPNPDLPYQADDWKTDEPWGKRNA